MSRYPSDVELEAIKKWDWADSFNLFKFVFEIWAYPDYALWDEDSEELTLCTGGWSGNEDIIHALQSNWIVWSMAWVSSHRGGKFVFDIGRMRCKKHTPS